ncbi:hypothetical protein GCM10009606_18190 [Nocardioides aquiterrae]|uniref:Transcription factor zinc-finger domain-containing protein n=1 Tax=Nocardioides aquiterrae TaxID=203799 RepID=A0ABN1UC74_9ACTN
MTINEQHQAESACPECGGTDWSTASDGLGSVASVAACCLGCGYLTASVVDLSTPPGVGQ